MTNHEIWFYRIVVSVGLAGMYIVTGVAIRQTFRMKAILKLLDAYCKKLKAIHEMEVARRKNKSEIM